LTVPSKSIHSPNPLLPVSSSRVGLDTPVAFPLTVIVVPLLELSLKVSLADHGIGSFSFPRIINTVFESIPPLGFIARALLKTAVPVVGSSVETGVTSNLMYWSMSSSTGI